jgi:hypothetical protein
VGNYSTPIHTFAAQEMQPPDGMPGLAVDLRQREAEFSRG